MAKKRRRGTGSVIAVKPLSGLGKVSRPGSILGSFVPPLVAGVAAGGGALLVEHMGKPSNGEQPTDIMITLAENAPWVGAGLGAGVGLAMWPMFGASAALAGVAGALGVSGALLAYKMLTATQSTATTDPATGPTVSTQGLGAYRYRRMRGIRGTGAIVPQLMPPGMNGLGAIVMEPSATRGLGDPRGETVSLGNVNPSAFGTPGFTF